MKIRLATGLILLPVLTFLSVLTTLAQAPEPLTGPPPSATPTPVLIHIPFDPLKRSDTLPPYPYNDFPSLQPAAKLGALAKPAGIDLDVTYISRTPMYNRYDVWYMASGESPYLRPGTESDRRWPESGELVTFTAHTLNKGTQASGNFTFRWFVDGVEVHSGVHSSLNPGQEATETYQWVWDHTLDGERLLGSHTIRFTVDPDNTISETYESNNSIEDHTDALSLVLAVTPALYAALETPIDPQWPYSAEDWLQKQIAAMNEAFARSVYSTTPAGIIERVRLDKILVAPSAPPADWSEDGGFFMSADDRYGNSYYDPTTDVSGALLHELTHQLGIIDLYRLDIALEIPQVLDRLGQPIQMAHASYDLLPGLMNNPGIRPPIYDEHTALALNANKGYRRGYYGEYLYDVPNQNYLRILDNRGNPVAGVTAKLYQPTSSGGQYGSQHGTIDNVAEITATTDTNGLALLPNRAVSMPITTQTGHTLQDNPFSTINVIGVNDIFILELSKDTHQEFIWLDITRFNLTTWHGQSGSATFEIASHVPPDDASLSPPNLSGIQEVGQVKLQWPSLPGAIGYNVYRTSGPTCTYRRLVTETTALSHIDAYDNSAPAIDYAVTAVDGLGRESGFSNFFYALRLNYPMSIVVDEQNNHLVLDPQNGYALLYQLSDNTFVDTRGSFDYHLEYSWYLARDSQGHLIISHPGDFYSSRHSVRVADQHAYALFEFGERGLGLGQFEHPAGVAAWESCSSPPCPYRILVVDSGNHRVQAFDAGGNFITAYGSPGNGAGQFNNPQGLVVDEEGNVIIADSGNNRLQMLGFDGTQFSFVKSITADFFYPTGVAIDIANQIIVVADAANHQVKIVDKQGDLLNTFNGPTDGRSGTFNWPRGVAVDQDGRVIVADTGNKRVVTIIDPFALPPMQEVYLPVIMATE